MIVRARKRAITSPQVVYQVLSGVLSAESDIDIMKEHFWVVGVNTRNVILYVELVSLGTLNASLVHPREVFRFAILKAVSSIILGEGQRDDRK